MFDVPSIPCLVFGLANLSLLLFLLLQFQKKCVPANLAFLYRLSIAWKLLFTLLLSALYYYYFPYDTDPKVLFHASQDLREALDEHPEKTQVLWGQLDDSISHIRMPRAFFVVKMLFFLNYLTGNSYWIDGIWLSFFTFFSCWLLCLELLKNGRLFFESACISLLVIPSTIFWSSGIMKETIGLGAMCLLLVCFMRFFSDYKFGWKSVLLAILPVYVLFSVRFYVLGTCLLLAIPYYLAKKHTIKLPVSVAKRSFLFIMMVIILSIVANWMSVLLYKVDMVALTYYTYEYYLHEGNADYTFAGLNTSFTSFLPYLPTALWYGLFGPPIWKYHSLLTLADSLLQLLFGGLAVWCAIRHLRGKRPISVCITASLLFILINAVFIAIGAPNFGSLVRYKTLYMPIFHCLILHQLLKQIEQTTAGTQFLAYFSSQKKGHS